MSINDVPHQHEWSQERKKMTLSVPEREYKMIGLARMYAVDPFGAPNHLAMMVINKLTQKLFDEGYMIRLEEKE
jgi:hypothetical protein